MPLSFASFVTSTFDQSDWLKLMGIVGAMVALYLLARMLGGGDDSVTPPVYNSGSTQFSASQTELTVPPETHDAEEDDLDEPDDKEQPTIDAEEVQPRNIQISDWSFAKFEVEAGPPDRDSFADELSVNLYDKSTGHTWNQTYLVATPAGLEKKLRRSKSSFMILPQILVMNRYDVSQLRKAVLGDLGAMEAERGDVPPDAIDAAEAERSD